MSEVYEYYVQELAELLKEYALEAREELDAALLNDRKHLFLSGVVESYYEVLSIMIRMARDFGISLEDLQLDDFDPERELLVEKGEGGEESTPGGGG